MYKITKWQKMYRMVKYEMPQRNRKKLTKLMPLLVMNWMIINRDYFLSTILIR